MSSPIDTFVETSPPLEYGHKEEPTRSDLTPWISDEMGDVFYKAANEDLKHAARPDSFASIVESQQKQMYEHRSPTVII
jgi:hypothetical protein